MPPPKRPSGAANSRLFQLLLDSLVARFAGGHFSRASRSRSGSASMTSKTFSPKAVTPAAADIRPAPSEDRRDDDRRSGDHGRGRRGHGARRRARLGHDEGREVTGEIAPGGVAPIAGAVLQVDLRVRRNALHDMR